VSGDEIVTNGIPSGRAYERLTDGATGARSVAEQPMAGLPDDWPGWQFDAACRSEDTALFFAPGYFEKRRQKDAREAKAKAICARCPVRDPCLDYALRVREGHGVWGGMNELERRQVLRQRSLRAG